MGIARHRLQALRCLPNWKAGLMPDIEAASSASAGAYVAAGAYWGSFDAKSPDAAREQLILCLEREGAWPFSEDSAARGNEDARRMKSALASLGPGTSSKQ